MNSPARARPAASWFDSELSWYVNQREGDMGVTAMPLEPGTGGVPSHDGIGDTEIRAATRARRAEEALARLPPTARICALAAHAHLSPRAHKDRHAALARFLETHSAAIVMAVRSFRAAWIRR